MSGSANGARGNRPAVSKAGFLGVSWFAFIMLAIPLVLLVYAAGESFDLRFADSAGSNRTSFTIAVAGFTLFVVTLLAMVPAVMVFLLTRRSIVWPTLVFLLCVAAGSAWTLAGIHSSDRAFVEKKAVVADSENVNQRFLQKAADDIEAQGFIKFDEDLAKDVVRSIEQWAAVETNPETAAALRATAAFASRISELMSAYTLTIQPYLDMGSVDPESIRSEDDLLARLDSVELGIEKCKIVVQTVAQARQTMRTMLETEGLGPRAVTTILAAFETNSKPDLLLRVHQAELAILEASHEQLMIYLDTFGLWENVPGDGIYFDDSLDASYKERFSAAYEKLQQAARDQAEAQREFLGLPPAPDPAAPDSEPSADP